MKKIIIGTHNKGKFKEISSLLSQKIKKISPLNLKIKSPKETGKSFLENSKLKAIFFSKKSNMVAISDDSGLEIAALNNKPGIHSARWAKRYGGFEKTMRKILMMMENKKNRKATFVCCLTLKKPNKKPISTIGKVRGTLSKKILGKKGFGYDPIFVPKNYKKTFAQMKLKYKMKIDHRYIAFKKLQKKLKFLKI